MKHPHAELIKAWADGAEIQVFHPNLDTWDDCTYNPSWMVNIKYRIKPEPKPDVVEYFRVGRRTYSLTFEWSDSPRANLKLIYDGETGDLKSAEVIK